ncbi:MAG TPA: DUF3530 domain-containing protein, partial [Pseudomonas sp.]|nr:DUF3530 domain-containing protein [Pseudomonas sp.]
ERAAQKANKGYRQIDLPVIPGDRAAEQEQTVRRLRAWLDRLPPAASESPAAS